MHVLGGVAAGGVVAGGSCYFLVVLVAFQISDQDGARDQRSFIALYSDFYIYFRSPAGSARRLHAITYFNINMNLFRINAFTVCTLVFVSFIGLSIFVTGEQPRHADGDKRTYTLHGD